MSPMAFKLLIAPDKFKGTLTSDDVAAAVASGRNPAGDNPWNRVADLFSSLAPLREAAWPRRPITSALKPACYAGAELAWLAPNRETSRHKRFRIRLCGGCNRASPRRIGEQRCAA